MTTQTQLDSSNAALEALQTMELVLIARKIVDVDTVMKMVGPAKFRAALIAIIIDQSKKRSAA